MGRAQKTISEFIPVFPGITPQTAGGLEEVLGIPASFWLR
jgi:plasmid maintenance system antidote protein VapI